MAKGTGYRMILRKADGSIGLTRDYPFTPASRNQIKAEMRDYAQQYGNDCIVRGYRCNKVANDLTWYAININGKVYFSSRKDLHNRSVTADIINRRLERARENEDERYDRLAEYSGYS